MGTGIGPLHVRRRLLIEASPGPGADAADNLEGYEQGWDVKHLKALRSIVER